MPTRPPLSIAVASAPATVVPTDQRRLLLSEHAVWPFPNHILTRFSEGPIDSGEPWRSPRSVFEHRPAAQKRQIYGDRRGYPSHPLSFPCSLQNLRGTQLSPAPSLVPCRFPNSAWCPQTERPQEAVLRLRPHHIPPKHFQHMGQAVLPCLLCAPFETSFRLGPESLLRARLLPDR